MRFVGWVIRWGDVSACHRETVARHGLVPVRDMVVKVAWPIPMMVGHGVTPEIARVGHSARLVVSDEGLWLSAEVGASLIAQDAAARVRDRSLQGWSMEFVELSQAARTHDGLRLVRRGVLVAATLVGEPSYPRSTVQVVA